MNQYKYFAYEINLFLNHIFFRNFYKIFSTSFIKLILNISPI